MPEFKTKKFNWEGPEKFCTPSTYSEKTQPPVKLKTKLKPSDILVAESLLTRPFVCSWKCSLYLATSFSLSQATFLK